MGKVLASDDTCDVALQLAKGRFQVLDVKGWRQV